MKILHVISSLDLTSGGPSKSISDLALNQSLRGHNVTIFTQISFEPFLRESPNPNLKIQFTKKNSLKHDLNNLIKAENFEILHGHGIWEMPVHYMAQLGRKYGIPYVITPRGTLHPWALSLKKWKKKLAMLFYQKKDLEKAFCLHATSGIEAKYFRDFGIKIPISVISNGIDLKEFPLLKTKKVKEKFILLFLSRVHSQKGLSILIDAWQQLDKGLRENWQIEIAGNGEDNYIASLQKGINDKGLATEIRIIGPQFGEAKLAAFNRADLFVLPTYSENFGIVIAEALACGVPVITTKGTPWEELNTCNAGWWIDIGAKPLAETLTKALQLKKIDLQTLGVNGRNLIEEKYSIQSVASCTLELYQWILGKGIKPKFVSI